MKKLNAVVLALTLCLSVGCASKHKNKGYETKHYETKRAKGLKKNEQSKQLMRSFPREQHTDKEAPIPGKVDLSKIVSPPEDQGKCGACWDFSLTKTLRSEFMLNGHDPGQLEFNYLLNNCGPGPLMNGCEGGGFEAAISFQRGHGPGLNAKDLYVAAEGTCKNLAVQATAGTWTLLGHKGSSPTFKDIAYAIGVQKHVLSIDVAAGSGNWESYSGGIYDDCVGSASDVDHMINAVGFNCESSVDALGNCQFDGAGRPLKGDGYLLIMNNWGNEWGTNDTEAGHAGYMKTRMYDKKGNHCNAVATDALFFDIKVPTEHPSGCKGFMCSELNCAPSWCKHE
jgi:C1A family cysteine protease